MVIVDKVQDIIVPCAATADEVTKFAKEVELQTLKKQFGHAMIIKVFCADHWDERSSLPYVKPTKLTETVDARLEALVNDLHDGEVLIICCGGHAANERYLEDKLKMEIEVEDPETGKTKQESKLRVLAQYLMFSDAGATLGQRKRGVGQGQNVERFFICTTHKSKPPSAFKKTSRLNSSGTSHSSCVLGLTRPHHRTLAQLKSNDKQLILAHDKKKIDVTSVTKKEELPKEFPRRMHRARDRVSGSLPLNWRPKEVATWREILNIVPNVARCQVIDFSIPSGELAIASLSLGCTYAGFVLNKIHKEFVLSVVDAGLPQWMAKPGPIFQGDSMATLIEKLFPAIKAPEEKVDESDSESEG